MSVNVCTTHSPTSPSQFRPELTAKLCAVAERHAPVRDRDVCVTVMCVCVCTPVRSHSDDVGTESSVAH
jgi:hypothetical protein